MINGKKVVALCTYRIHEAQEFAFISELSENLKNNNCHLFIYALNSEIGIATDTSPEIAVFDLIPYDKVDVVVIMNEKIKVRDVSQSIIDRACSNNIPVIVVDGEYENVSMVRYDYAKGFENVVRHIIEDHKVKKPHFMAGHKNNSFSEERLEVFKKVLSQNNMPFDDSMVSYGDFWALPCRAATQELLKRDELPDSIICANDIMAINVCDVLSEAGIRVPEDVIVSGFDGIDEAFLSSPGITTAVCDNTELANAVFESVMDALSGHRNETKLVEPVFISNESCGCQRKELHKKSTVSELNNLFYHHEDEIRVYQNIISKVMTDKDTLQSIYYLKENHGNYALVVTEKSCFDLEQNYFYDDVKGGDKLVVFDPYIEDYKPYPYDPTTIVPHLDKLMESGEPLIFNSLVYMDKSCGFVCYAYPRTMLIDYNQTSNLTNCFEMSIGGYVLTRHQKYLRDKLSTMYQNDALTGLYNRLAFLSKIDERIQATGILGKKVNIIMLDLNDLKKINDNLGHMAGDKAIKAVATALKDSCPEEAICVRTGGDEMLALLIGDYDVDGMLPEIEKKIERSSDELGFTVSASIGTSSLPYKRGEETITKAIGLADERMYVMKRTMKNANKSTAS